MEKQLFTITSKDFLTGIAPSAHTERGGLFATADGVTPVYNPGGVSDVENGLLQPGPAPTEITGGVVVDTIMAATSGFPSTTQLACFLGNDGHFYRLLTNGTLSDLRSGTPITTPRSGLVIWKPTASADSGVLYWQNSQIGLWDGSGSYPTGWTDNKWTGLRNTLHPAHVFQNQVYYGNGWELGALEDDGAGSTTHTTNKLRFDGKHLITSISDDGAYLVIALTENQDTADINASNKIIFWDTFSPLQNREHIIRDPFIYNLTRMGNTVIAFGQNGIYQVTFDGGVQKLPYSVEAFGTPGDVLSGFGTYRADVFNQSALIFANDTTINSIGQLSPELPGAYFTPFKVPAGGTPSCVFTNFATGSIYVAIDNDKLYRYDFNNATRETAVSFRTIYFNVKQKVQINRIDVVFGEPLASGDSFSVALKTDADTSVQSFGSATFTADGAIRRKSLYGNVSVEADEQIAIEGTFTAGAVKIKSIHVYGQIMQP